MYLLNANPIPSYMIKSSGIVAILKSLLNSDWDLKFYSLHVKSNEVENLKPLSNILKQLMVMLKIQVK